MEIGTTKSKCASASHQQLMENAKNRVNDLQERFLHLQSARVEGRIGDFKVLEEQVNQSLREWKDELNAPSPSSSSLLAASLGSFSDEIARLLQPSEEEDDATSKLSESPASKADTEFRHNLENLDLSSLLEFQEVSLMNNDSHECGTTNPPQQHEFQGFDQFIGCASGAGNSGISISDLATHFDYDQFGSNQGSNNAFSANISCDEGFENTTETTGVLAYISPPPSAFMGPKCALWDCTRPAQGTEWYCSTFHVNLAYNEGSPGMTPVCRPGIVLKDNILFDALRGKTLGKCVGIPHCEGAATTKSPWNATELFDLTMLEGQTIREWLFFDKPRRAFDSGNRKQRSLPDHVGRGWHESRKQVMKELGGQKRSYYMDPQPLGNYEWHLFEYEINNSGTFALYRLELKLSNGKKSPKLKVTKDPLAELQKKMGRLTAEFSSDNKSPENSIIGKDDDSFNVHPAETK